MTDLGSASVQSAPAAWDLRRARVPAEFVAKVPLRFARDNAVVAVQKVAAEGHDSYWLVTGHPERQWVLDRLAYKLGGEVRVQAAPEEEVQHLVARAYHAEAQDVAEVAGELAAEAAETPEIELAEDVLELDDKAPAVKLVHAMLLQAVRQRASDIHLDPAEEGVRVRLRIDGVLYERARLQPDQREAVTSRIKVMARMDIAERRLPQDGGVTVRIGQRRIDLRIATLPCQFGERVVLRLLDKQMGLLSLDRLGLASAHLAQARRLLECAHGIVLVTGPTGCGKTTTLYAMLSEMNSAELNILTLEDPIEYQLPGVSQTQVNERKGLTFARGLRALVRQDPDVIMVGEIRDLETATVAIQSALTGHLVFSTLHTNDAPASVTRLLDLGVEPYLVASSVVAVMAQRLVRVLCPSCRQSNPFDPAATLRDGWSEEEVAFLKKLGVGNLPQATGCAECIQTGFMGRTGLHELLVMGDAVRDLVTRHAPAGEIKKAAVARGMLTLRRDGLDKVAQGLTTLSEVRAATQMDLE